MEKVIVSINTANQLEKLLDFIHDNFFDLEKTKYCKDNKEVSIFFQKELYEKKEVIKQFMFFNKIKIPIVEYLMIIENVNNVVIDDINKVRYYDFNFIDFDTNQGRVKINTNIPIKFEIYVSSLLIKVLTDNKQIGYKNEWTVL